MIESHKQSKHKQYTKNNSENEYDKDRRTKSELGVASQLD